MAPVQHNHTTKPYDLFMQEARADLQAQGIEPDAATLDATIQALIDAGVMDMDVDEAGDVYLTTRLEYTEAYHQGEV